jgi:hypothetical protein
VIPCPDPLPETIGGGDGMTVLVQQYLSTGPKLSRYKTPMRTMVPAKRSM